MMCTPCVSADWYVSQLNRDWETYLDSCFGDADGLLFHSFVDRHLVPRFHLIKLIDAAHTLQTHRVRTQLSIGWQSNKHKP